MPIFEVFFYVLKLLYSVPPHFQKMVMIRATCIIFQKKKDRFAALHSMLIQYMSCRSVLPTVLPDDEISKAKQRKSEDFQEILGSRSALLDQARRHSFRDAVLQSISPNSISQKCTVLQSSTQYCKVLYHLPLVLQSIVTDTGRRRGEKKILRFSVGTGSKSALCLYM